MKTLKFKSVIILMLLFIGDIVECNAQFFAELTNPKVKINIEHPAGIGLKINKIAFNSAIGGRWGDQINDALIQDFVSHKAEVIDRAHLNSILAEHSFNNSGYVDQSTAVLIGKIIGPSALLSVKVIRGETEVNTSLYKDEKEYNDKTKQSNTVRYYIARTSAFLKVSVQTTDLTTGRIFAAKVFDYAPFIENRSSTGRPEVPSEIAIQETAIRALVTDVSKLYFPWTEPAIVTCFNEKDGGLNQAYDALKSGDIVNATNLSQSILENCKTKSDVKEKTLSHAYYNLGLCLMIQGDYDKALENLRAGQAIKGGSIFDETINNCLKSKVLASELQRVETNASLIERKSQEENERAAVIQQSSTLTNTDIIIMFQKKIPKIIIIQKIKTSLCKFDNSTDAIVALTAAGVTEDVILLMIEKK
jgi:tetratricopeptide (TPR) repeat protein